MAKAKEPRRQWFPPDPWADERSRGRNQDTRKMFDQVASEKKPQNHVGKHLGVLLAYLKRWEVTQPRRHWGWSPAKLLCQAPFHLEGDPLPVLEVQVLTACCHLGFNCAGRTPEWGASPQISSDQVALQQRRSCAPCSVQTSGSTGKHWNGLFNYRLCLNV